LQLLVLVHRVLVVALELGERLAYGPIIAILAVSSLL
jgi:hypothetical protein